METVRETWTDERLDRLNHEVETGFADVDRRFQEVDRRFEQVDKRFDRVEGEVRLLREDMHGRFETVDRSLDALDGRLHALQRTMLVFCTTMMATLAGLAGTQLFLLLTGL